MHRLPFQELIAVIALIVSLSSLGCGPADPCETRLCVNGICVAGDCACDAGWEGADCELRARDKFLGTAWNNSLTCQSSTDYLLAEVQPGASHQDMWIYNLNAQGDSVTAYAGHDTIYVPEQVYGVDYIEGIGLWGDASFTVEYVIRTTTLTETHCVAYFQR